MRRCFTLFITFAYLFFPLTAVADPDCLLSNDCGNFRGNSSSASPGTQLKINPSAVPTEKGFGIEAIYFSSETDFSLVRGTGRMGAAISPTNSEETFFGAPGIEYDTDLLGRKEEKKKYPSQKITLATAFNLAEKKGSGFKSYSLKIGAMGKYNTLSKNTNFGGGLNGTWGPLSAGGAMYNDETQLELGPSPPQATHYQVQTYNMGLYLNSLILNYANLRLKLDDADYLKIVHLYTASLTLGQFILTAAKRIEDSPTPDYNDETHQLETKQIKEAYFGGIQYAFTKTFMAGALYNYYLLKEASITATLFF